MATSSRVVGRECLDAQFGGERGKPVLGRADELGAELSDGAALEPVIADAAADPLAGLDHRDLEAGALQVTGGGESGEAGADHYGVYVEGRGGGGLHVYSPSCKSWAIDLVERPSIFPIRGRVNRRSPKRA
jgi:hypothetical protein